VFIGDEFFFLRADFLKPLNQRELRTETKAFNYVLSRASKAVENAFGILGARFKVFHTNI
jgi:hypothetical protein